MGWTKGQIVDEAYGELALQGYIYDLSPEMRLTGLRRLDAMMAMWQGKGIRLGYPLPSAPDTSDIDSASNIPDIAIEPVFLNLAVRLAAGFGKQLAPSTLIAAKDGFDMLMGRAAMPPEVQYPETLPRGAGSKPWRWQVGPFMPPPTDPLTTGPDSELDFE